MWNFIRKLQQKPEGERKRIVFLTASGITLIIAGIWSTSFYFNVLGTPDGEIQKTTETSPIMTIKDNLSSVYRSISEPNSSTSTSTEGL